MQIDNPLTQSLATWCLISLRHMSLIVKPLDVIVTWKDSNARWFTYISTRFSAMYGSNKANISFQSSSFLVCLKLHLNPIPSSLATWSSDRFSLFLLWRWLLIQKPRDSLWGVLYLWGTLPWVKTLDVDVTPNDSGARRVTYIPTRYFYNVLLQ